MPPLIQHFDDIRKRRDEIRARSMAVMATRQPSLRALIESGAAWWPSDAVTDGADHFVLPSIVATNARAACAPPVQDNRP